jgi:hypothetical protein
VPIVLKSESLNLLEPYDYDQGCNGIAYSSNYRDMLIYAHTISRTLAACDISPVLQTLPVPEAGGFVE